MPVAEEIIESIELTDDPKELQFDIGKWFFSNIFVLSLVLVHTF